MKKIQYLVFALLISTSVMGQNLVDALRYSDNRIEGTARAAAMGNAFGSLGGDFTSTSINPAGIGLYRSSEFVITPKFGKTNVDGSYLNSTYTDSKYNIGIPNLGYVANFNTNSNNGGSLVSISVGLGYNRLNNFNMNKMVVGNGATSSMLDMFSLNSDGLDPVDLDPFYEQLAAYNQSTGVGTDLLYNNEDGIYAHDMQINPYTDDFTNYAHSQRKSFTQRGSIDEYVMSLAANFNHRFYVGATLGLQDLYYRENTSLTESDVNYGSILPDTYLNEYSFDTYLRTIGTGYNLKVGAIYKPIDELRLGFAYHSPTFYKLHDRYDNSMYSTITYSDGVGNYEAYSPIGNYNYELQTPMKTVLSAAYVVGKAGLISLDYEIIDYSSIKLRDGSDGYNFFNENEEIQTAYKAVANIHLGGEYRVTDNFSLRGGYEYYPSPFKKNAFNVYQPNSNADESSISAGFGWKQGGFFFDMAYKHNFGSNYVNLYEVPETIEAPVAKFENMGDYATFTLGFRF